MKKIFLQYNSIRKSLADKYADIQEQKIESDQEIYNYLNFLLFFNARSFYIPENTDFDELCGSLSKWLSDEHKLSVERSDIHDIITLKIVNTSKLAKFFGFSKPVSLVISKKGSYLSFFFIDTKWFDNPTYDKKLQKGSFFTNFFVDNIEKFIFDFLHQNNKNTNVLNYASNENFYVEKFNSAFQNFFLADREDKEILLAWLPVNSLKNIASNKTYDKKSNWFFVMSNFDSFLLCFDKNGIIIDAFDLQNRKIEVKKKFKTNINVENYLWTASLSDYSKYSEISKCSSLSNLTRINEFVKLNVSKSKNYNYFNFAKFLLSQLDEILAPIKIFLLDFIIDKQKTTKEYTENGKLNKIVTDILNSSQAEEALVFWFNDWKLSKEQSVFILKILSEASENKLQLKSIFPFHSLVYQNILVNEKEKYNKILYDIEFSRHLIGIEKYDEAEKILKNDLKKMPDLAVFDLLPPSNVDPTGELSGKFLKVLILDLLSNVVPQKEAKNYIKDIAQLQPLSINKVYDLTAVDDEVLKRKSKAVLNILKGEGLNQIPDKQTTKYLAANPKDLNELKHESVQKNGTLHSFTKWISTYKTPEVSAVKKFADRMTPAKHQNVAEIIADLIHFFAFQNLEVYISYGEYSVGVRAYEANPPFIVIGNEHLIENSPYILTYNELKFAIAYELAFLYFKFSKITATDIWRGAMEKGNFVLDSFINLIPFAGNVSSLLKNAQKINLLSNFIQKNEQISRTLSKGQKIITAGEKSTSLLIIASQMLDAIKNTKPSKENAKKEELIAISRMMQITADRIALLITNDIVSAVRSTFLTSKIHLENLVYANKYGLNSFILKKNEHEEYINLNFAVRFASMFSFWFSDKFETFYKKIIEK